LSAFGFAAGAAGLGAGAVGFAPELAGFSAGVFAAKGVSSFPPEGIPVEAGGADRESIC